jgi:hypothetical protein
LNFFESNRFVFEAVHRVGEVVECNYFVASWNLILLVPMVAR